MASRSLSVIATKPRAIRARAIRTPTTYPTTYIRPYHRIATGPTRMSSGGICGYGTITRLARASSTSAGQTPQPCRDARMVGSTQNLAQSLLHRGKGTFELRQRHRVAIEHPRPQEEAREREGRYRAERRRENVHGRSEHV